MCMQKPSVTILAAIRSQANKRKNGALQEVLPVRGSHIRAVTLRAEPCSPHETGFGRATNLPYAERRKKCRRKWVIAREANQAGPTLINGPWRFHAALGPISLDNLPRINQRGEIQADDIYLQFDFIAVLNYGAYYRILDFPVVQVHADFVADLELPVVWLLCGWHARGMYLP